MKKRSPASWVRASASRSAGASNPATARPAVPRRSAAQCDHRGRQGNQLANSLNAAQAPGGNSADQAGGINLNISLGSSRSDSRGSSQSDTARGSTVQAGGNVSIVATGGGHPSAPY